VRGVARPAGGAAERHPRSSRTPVPACSVCVQTDAPAFISAIGRATLSLLRFGLVDRLNLWLYPLLLGTGEQWFADGTVPTALRLTESVTHPNGTLHLAYETAGAPTYGTLA
jgi:hypothetical protein